MTKNELIKTVSDNTGMTQKVAEEAIGAERHRKRPCMWWKRSDFGFLRL